MTPQDIVTALDQHIVGHEAAKRAIALALRNRWRRLQLNEHLQPEIRPSNVLLTGPSGVGKTELLRQTARALNVPYVIASASSFTAYGYLGRDIDHIVDDMAATLRNYYAQLATGPAELVSFDRLSFGSGQPALKRVAYDYQPPSTNPDDDDGRTDGEHGIRVLEEQGIVFIDDFDSLVGASGDLYATSRAIEVQRNLVTLMSGTYLEANIGTVRTNNLLWIACGTFNDSRPTDLIPTLQARFPIRAELDSLTFDDLRTILTGTSLSLIDRANALLATEGVTVEFSEDAFDTMADAAADLNYRGDDIGAHRLIAVLDRVLEETSFLADTLGPRTMTIDGALVRERLADLAEDDDLSGAIL